MSSISDFYRRRAAEQDTSEPEPAAVVASEGTTHSAGAFTISLPDGWSDQTMHIFVGPVEDDVQHTVNVVVDREAGPDVEEYASTQVAALESTLKGLSVLRRETGALWSGPAAVRVVLEWLPAPGSRIVQEQLYVIKDSTGYRLTATFSPSTFETMGPRVRAMLLSFEPA
jgi:hypothetical protein